MLDAASAAAWKRIDAGDGSAPYLLVELDDPATLSQLARAESAEGAGGVPVGAVLKPDERLWFEALRTNDMAWERQDIHTCTERG